MYFVIRCFILSSLGMEYIDWECHESLKIKINHKYGIACSWIFRIKLTIFCIESVKIYIIFWYIIPTVLLMVLLCIHCPVDTNKRWYFYPIYYGSSNTPRSIVYKSHLFRTENLRQCVFHRETLKGQQHHLKAYHVWDNFLK